MSLAVAAAVRQLQSCKPSVAAKKWHVCSSKHSFASAVLHFAAAATLAASASFLLLCPKLLLLFHVQLLSHLLFELPFSLGKQCFTCFRLTVYILHVESSSHHPHPPAPVLHGIFENPPFCVVYDVTETLANYLFGIGVGLKCAVDK